MHYSGLREYFVPTVDPISSTMYSDINLGYSPSSMQVFTYIYLQLYFSAFIRLQGSQPINILRTIKSIIAAAGKYYYSSNVFVFVVI